MTHDLARFWDCVYRGFHLSESERRTAIDEGIAAADAALALNPDHLEAILYKSLFLRLRAERERDPLRRQEMLQEATRLRDRAHAVRRQQAASGNR